MPGEATEFLNALTSGGGVRSEKLLPLVYQELRQLAARRMSQIPPGQTLQATALVHEAWLRVEKSGRSDWDSRAHFFAAASEAMRRILVEQARRKSAKRHGGGLKRVEYEEVAIASEAPEERVLEIDEALEKLEEEDPLRAEVVKLRFFGGLRHPEIAKLLEISEKTAWRHWNAAKLRLHKIIEEGRS